MLAFPRNISVKWRGSSFHPRLNLAFHTHVSECVWLKSTDKNVSYVTLYLEHNLFSFSKLLVKLRIFWLSPLPTEKNKCPEYSTKLHFMVWREISRSRDLERGNEVLFHCHYSQIHSDPEWLYLLLFYRWLRYICLKVIHIRNTWSVIQLCANYLD